MSAIPPDIAGAAAQAGFAAGNAARARDADRTGQARAAAQQEQARVDQANSVDADDMDTAVFSDAEGAGSQGRAYSDAAPADAEEGIAADDGDDESPSHLDIQA